MNNDMIISVIVPVYNTEHYLSECVQSIKNQTYQNLDIILVDDGSTDGSPKLCDEYAKLDSRIRVIHKKNGGLVSAWSTGLLDKNSSSEFVVFVDSDDWIEKNHISFMVEEQEKTGADIVVVRMKQIYSDKKAYIDFVVEPKFYSGDRMIKELYPKLLNAGGFETRGIPVSRCSKLIRKSLLLKNLEYSENKTTYEEDLNIMFPVFMDMNSISLLMCENAAYCYRMNENSMLHAYDKNMQLSIEHVFSSIRLACNDKSQHYFDRQIDIEYLTAMVRACTNELQNPLGLKVGFIQVRKLSKDKELKRVIKEVTYKNFPFKFRIVVFMMSHADCIWTEMLFDFLYIAKRFSRR